MPDFIDLGIKITEGRVRGTSICPQCNGTRQKHKNAQCLTWNNEVGNRWYKCHHCNWSGNLDIIDQYKQVQEKSRMPQQMPEIYSKEVMEYWKRRKIDYRICIKEKIFEFSMGRDRKPILGFPVYINQTLVNVKYLDIRWKPGDEGPKWWQMPKRLGTNIIPWGMQSLSFEPEQPKIVTYTEGEIDRLTWMTAGYKNVLSEPQGAPSVNSKDFKDKFAYMDDAYVKSVFADVELFIFSTDGDEPGRMLRNHLSFLLGKDRCKYINYPVGYKDINEVWAGDTKKNLTSMGQQGVDECYQNLSSFPIKGVIRPSDCREDLSKLAKNGFEPGLGIGVPEVDKLFSIKPKHFSVITGVPSAGKSSWVRWYLTELTRHNSQVDMKWALFTPENRPVAREYAKIAEVMTGQSFREGFYNSMTPDLRDRTMRFIEKHFFIVSPDRLNFESWNGKIDSSKINTMESLLNYLIYLKRTEGIFGFLIDAWNKIEHEQPRNMTETSFISQQLDYLINFADTYDVHAMVIVHPRKIDQQGINYKMPSLYDIKGSSAWKEKPDLGIIIHRYMNKRKKNGDIPEGAEEEDKYYVDNNAPTIIYNEKVRFEELGVMGQRIKMTMDYKKGCRFVMYQDEEKKALPSPGVSPLNPDYRKEKHEDDVFGDKRAEDDLPF